MGENLTNKLDFKWYQTNADKAKMLLQKYDLLGAEKVIANDTNLKVLFGKGGVLRLLCDSWTTTEEISMFTSMAKTLIMDYQKNKMDTAFSTNEAVQVQLNKKREDFKQKLSNITKYYKNNVFSIYNKIIEDYNFYGKSNSSKIGTLSMNIKKKVRSLNKEIQTLQNEQQNLEAQSNANLTAYTNNVINATNNVNKNAQDLANLLDQSMQNKIDANQKKQQITNLSTVKNNLLKYHNEAIKLINGEIKTLNKYIKDSGLTMNRTFNDIEKFCKLCNELGNDYYKQKDTYFFSFTANKMKKEAARILKVLTPPPKPQLSPVPMVAPTEINNNPYANL